MQLFLFLFEEFGELFLDFGDLRIDDDLAVGLLGMDGEVVLVVAFGRPELFEWRDFGHDGSAFRARGREASDEFLCRLFLLGRGVEDGRTVLRADVSALAIERGRIVRGEEDSEEVIELHKRRIVVDLYDLGMAGRAGRDLLVCRILRLPSRIPGLDMRHALEHGEHGLSTPETSSAEYYGLHTTSI